jgi:hypothetical protein
MLDQYFNPWRVATLAQLRHRWSDPLEARHNETFAPEFEVRCTGDALMIEAEPICVQSLHGCIEHSQRSQRRRRYRWRRVRGGPDP